jgi:hypothetical protein
VLLGFGIVLWAYYSSPPSAAGYPGCECEDYLGRWWEPSYVIPIVVIGYFIWLFGMGVGIGTRSLLRRARRTDRDASVEP